jgi:hypothetical protein
MLALDDALKAARETVSLLEKAREAMRTPARLREARAALSDAVSSASYVDHIYLTRASSAVAACK